MITSSRPISLLFVLVVAVAVLEPLGHTANAQEASEVPRYVSLRADEVNVRTGPGVRYPVKWVFVRKSMPVEVIADYDTWRKIRDWEGAEGWVHRAMLSSKRHVITVGGLSTLRQRPSEESRAIAKLDGGVVAEIKECEATWCKLSVGGYEGWLRRDTLWGLKRGEIVR